MLVYFSHAHTKIHPTSYIPGKRDKAYDALFLKDPSRGQKTYLHLHIFAQNFAMLFYLKLKN